MVCAGIAAGVAAGCGGEAERQFTPLTVRDPGPVHVHGLGINPADGALFIATHTGLWRVGQGAQKASRVADRYQDTMGFTVLDANSFLGSGHPDVKEAREKGLPPLLGLIASRDAGKTWTPISLLGEADFHVLRSAGDRIYGFDATNLRLMVSEDAGRTWEERSLPRFPPEPLLDLVIDPADADRLIAATERDLYQSGDAGRTWRYIAPFPGLLAWLGDTFVLIDASGRVFTTADRGGN
jgi:Sortilin, neurotensin receptor 3,